MSDHDDVNPLPWDDAPRSAEPARGRRRRLDSASEHPLEEPGVDLFGEDASAGAPAHAKGAAHAYTEDDFLSPQDLLAEESADPLLPIGAHEAPARRSPLHLLPLLLVAAVVLALAAGGFYAYHWVSNNVNVAEEAPQDYEGSGTGEEVVIEVKDGDTGFDIASTLVDAGVIQSAAPFIQVFTASPEASTIQPGAYSLQKQMSSAAALDALLDPANVAGQRVTVPEGLTNKQIFARVSEATGIPVADFEEAAAHYTDYGLPENPAGSPEGYLWPGRYDIPEDATAGDVLTMMWERMESELDARGVAPEDRHRILTLASIAEKEARTPDDYGRVVRTLENRLDGIGEAGGRPMALQLDSTVAYFSGSDSISTTPQQRATDSPYNTYLHPGLPIGPISNPGGATLDAAVNPPAGDWLYWVTVNTETGETKFATTFAEHQQNVAQWQQWARERDAAGG